MARPRPGDGLAGGRGSQHRCLLRQRPDRNLAGHRPCGVVRLDLLVELLRVGSVHGQGPCGRRLGAGLSLARNAAQSLGARIEVTSQPLDGSEFRVILPAATAPSSDTNAQRATVGKP